MQVSEVVKKMNRIEKHAKNTFIILMLIMLFWIFMSFIFQKLLFPPSKNNLTTYEALKYYTHLKGYYGLDHISKGIISCLKLILILLFLLSILLVIYQTQSAQILFVFIDFLNFVALILVYLCTNPNNRSIDKIACVK